MCFKAVGTTPLLIKLSLCFFAAFSAHVFVNPCIVVLLRSLSDTPYILNEISDVGIDISLGATEEFNCKDILLTEQSSGMVNFVRFLQFSSERFLQDVIFLPILSSSSFAAFLNAV